MSSSYQRKRHYSLFPKPLSDGMRSPLEEVMKQRGFSHKAILHYWKQAAGEHIAPYCLPVRLKKGRTSREHRLVVHVHPAYVAIIAHESEAILQRLTRLIGYRPAERIVVISLGS